MVLLESTGEGAGGWWYDLWHDAEAGRNDYTAIFLTWLMQDEYRMDASDIIDLTKREQALVRDGADREQLAWRRWKIRNDFDSEAAFANQFPSNPEEAFIPGGNPVFTADHVQLARQTIREPIWIGEILPESDPIKCRLESGTSGSLRVWADPDPRYHYVIGADCQWGTKESADYDACYVQCLETSKVVASMWGHWDMGRWAALLASLGHRYNRAVLAPERNAQAGTGVVYVLMGRMGGWSYPNLWVRSSDLKLKGYRPEDYGWLTDAHSKDQLRLVSQELTTEGTMDWADKALVQEMSAFIRDDKGKMTCPPGGHDDRLMARMITATVAHRVRGMTDLYRDPVESNPYADNPWGSVLARRDAENEMKDIDE